jgi:Domain of unknown function (DUF4440)
MAIASGRDEMKRPVMRMLGAVLVCAGIVAGLAGGAGVRPAAAAGDDSAVLQADQAFVAAIRTGDKPALGTLLDADFSWTDVDGRTLTRAEALQELPKPLTNGGGSAPITTHVYGDVALVRTDDGLPHVLRVWVRRPAGWKAMVYQEVRSLAAPPTVTPGTGKDCENPCRNVLYQPKNEAERGVIASYMGLETASVRHDAPHWGPHVAEEFVAASSYSNKLLTKPERMADLAKSQMAGLAPTPVVTMRLVDFGDTVVMLSKQQPDKGKPLHITRVWTKRDGNWVIVVAFQTAIQAESGRS